METAQQPPVIHESRFGRYWVFFKIGGICFLILLLFVPLELTHGILQERLQYRAEAVSQIASVWGGRQTVTGPVLVVPYTYRGQVKRTKTVNGNTVQYEEPATIAGLAYFLPDELNVQGSIEPEIRYRGIFEAIVYSADLQLNGRFSPDFQAAGIAAESIQWEDARVLFGVTDPKGIRSVTPIKTGDGGTAAFENAGTLSRAANAPLNYGRRGEFLSDKIERETTSQGSDQLSLAARVSGAGDRKDLAFEFSAALQGSGGLEVAPVGKVTNVRITSPWANPSFTGASLPSNRKVESSGFEAEWRSTQFSRSFGQNWTSKQTELKDAVQTITASASGVDFAKPVDGYRLAERAQKYGVLFFVLVFAVFFLFEVTAPLRIHPLQYAMVGAALCLFFLGFLALSEFLTTGIAYAAAAAACTALVSFYSLSVLKSGRRTSVIAGGLVATYGYLYFVLKSQDYALLAGTVALFAALALVMFCTRRINWYSLEMNATPTRAQ